MTPKQTSLYWRSWSRVRKALVDLGGFTAEEADAERKAIMMEACGTDSSKALTNRQLDKCLDAFDRAAVLVAGPTAANRAEEQPTKRLIHAIRSLGLPEPYLRAISRDQFQTEDWEQLNERQLSRLRYTATSRARARARAKS